MKSVMKKIGVVFMAFMLAGAGQIGLVVDVFADGYDPMESLISVSGEPDGTRLVAENATSDYYRANGITDYGDGIMLAFGKNDIWQKMNDFGLEPAEWPDDDPEKCKEVAKMYDDFGYYWTSNELIDFHLIDVDTGEEVGNDANNEIAITIDIGDYYGLNSDEGDSAYDELIRYSDKEWEKGFMHLSDDGKSREFVPATEDADGNWTIKIRDFSVFLPVLRYATDDTEPVSAPKTLDNAVIYIGGIAISLAFALWIGVQIKKTRS